VYHGDRTQMKSVELSYEWSPQDGRQSCPASDICRGVGRLLSGLGLASVAELAVPNGRRADVGGAGRRWRSFGSSRSNRASRTLDQIANGRNTGTTAIVCISPWRWHSRLSCCPQIPGSSLPTATGAKSPVPHLRQGCSQHAANHVAPFRANGSGTVAGAVGSRCRGRSYHHPD